MFYSKENNRNLLNLNIGLFSLIPQIGKISKQLLGQATKIKIDKHCDYPLLACTKYYILASMLIKGICEYLYQFSQPSATNVKAKIFVCMMALPQENWKLKKYNNDNANHLNN